MEEEEDEEETVNLAKELPNPSSPLTPLTPQPTKIAKISAPHPELPLNDGKFHLLLAASGSVATIKIPQIVEKLYRIYEPSKISIQVIFTESAFRFLPAADQDLPSSMRIWRDQDEWSTWTSRSDPIVHIELRRWAHLLLIAPLSANTLAKIACGLCDNLLTNVIRAWNPSSPIWIAPAMNTYMYTSPITKRHFKLISDEMKWIEILPPVEKVLACGDIGMGGMREWSDIVERVVSRFPPSSYPRKNEVPTDSAGLIHEKVRPSILADPVIPGHVRFQDELDQTSDSTSSPTDE
ncbi:flavoprotein [Lipomyces oligophaga]|uniref:flavoprotein n=1 Tax=Lipomyces oligophaga TaxID=45792 RepID=UPI0034CE5786